MGNTDIEKIMIEKFKIYEKQSKELRENLDQYIDEFDEKNLYKMLCEHLKSELKVKYKVNEIDENDINDISRKCIDKMTKNDMCIK